MEAVLQVARLDTRPWWRATNLDHELGALTTERGRPNVVPAIQAHRRAIRANHLYQIRPQTPLSLASLTTQLQPHFH